MSDSDLEIPQRAVIVACQAYGAALGREAEIDPHGVEAYYAHRCEPVTPGTESDPIPNADAVLFIEETSGCQEALRLLFRELLAGTRSHGLKVVFEAIPIEKITLP